MSVENGGLGSEGYPENWEFSLLLGTVRSRFHDAKDLHRKLLPAGFRAFTIDQTRRLAPDILAWFRVADNLKRHTLVEAESIGLAVPVTQPDVIDPLLYEDAAHAYFMLQHSDELGVSPVLIDQRRAEKELLGEQPSLQGVMEKILMYTVIPVRKVSS